MDSRYLEAFQETSQAIEKLQRAKNDLDANKRATKRQKLTDERDDKRSELIEALNSLTQRAPPTTPSQALAPELRNILRRIHTEVKTIHWEEPSERISELVKKLQTQFKSIEPEADMTIGVWEPDEDCDSDCSEENSDYSEEEFGPDEELASLNEAEEAKKPGSEPDKTTSGWECLYMVKSPKGVWELVKPSDKEKYEGCHNKQAKDERDEEGSDEEVNDEEVNDEEGSSDEEGSGEDADNEMEMDVEVEVKYEKESDEDEENVDNVVEVEHEKESEDGVEVKEEEVGDQVETKDEKESEVEVREEEADDEVELKEENESEDGVEVKVEEVDDDVEMAIYPGYVFGAC